jgi:hypothetical protein
MGFWNDVANFAVGAIEQDKANTKERFAIRAEELQANRASLLKRKDKRYEKDIENYYKEKENFKTVESANAAFAKDNNVAQYAAKILPITIPGWKDIPEKQKINMINNYSGKTIDYKMKGTLDQIEQNAAMADAAITRYTSAALDDARGDRFLINKILGTKSKSEAEQLKDMEAAIKANNAIKLTETSVNPEFVGLDVKGTGGIYSNIDKTSDSYKTFRNKNYEQLKNITSLNSKVTSKDNNEAMKASFKNLGITNTKDYFKENNESGEIIGFMKGGENFAESVYSSYKHNQDFLKRNGTDYLFVKFSGQIGELPSYYGKSNMNGTVANRMKEYAVPVGSNNILGEDGRLNFKTVLRNEDNLIVIPTANTIDFDDTIFGSNRVLSDSEKSKVSQIYAKVLMAESSVPNKQGVMELNPLFLKQNQAKLQNLKYGETNQLLNQVNFSFGVALMKEGLLTKEQFLENNNNNRLYNLKTDKDETPFKDIVDNIKVTNVNQEDIPFVIVDGNTIPLTEKNKKYLDSINFDYSKPQTKSDIKSQPIEGDIDEQYIEGTEFNVKPEKPFALMSIEERREFQNKKAQERKEKIRKKNEEFNKKIAEANKRRQNNAVKSVKTNLPNENPDA